MASSKIRPPLTPLEMRVSAFIRSLREQNGWTQEAVAARTGIGRTGISVIENGKRPASLKLLEDIAAALGGRVVIRFVFNQDHPPMTDKQKAEAGGKNTASDLAG